MMSGDKLQLGHEMATGKSLINSNIYSGIPSKNLVDHAGALFKIHTEPKEIVLNSVMVSSKECSTTKKMDYCVGQSTTSPILAVSVNSIPLHLVQKELDSTSEIQSTLTPVIGILSPVASFMVEIPLTSNPLFLQFPRPITIISSIPTVSRLVSCIPYIMSTRIQPKIELQLNTINAHNILVSSTFIYGQQKLPRIEHLKYSMKTCYTGNHQSYSIDVMKVTCGTQVTQSLKLKCVENCVP